MSSLSTLYVATLRPTKDAPESTAYGTATLLLAPDQSRAKVAVGYSNLTSVRVSSHIKLGAPGQDGAIVASLYGDQPIALDWDFQPSGNLTSDDIRKALGQGLVYVGIDTKNHPTGELRGPFIRASGSAGFTPPPPAPRMRRGKLTDAEAARFLIQATFGPTRAQIDELLKTGIEGWIDEQMAVGASSHMQATRADFAAFPPANPKTKINGSNRQVAWWRIALTGPDQLRQRIAFALSESFVISDVNDIIAGNAEAAANYYDLLARHAFGNYRELLEAVTLNPMMGAYLNMFRNSKGDPAKQTSPDENYAREVMQLFTIGLNELQPDGTLRLGPDGLPIPTYDQHTITEMARVLTGWAFYSPEPRPNFHGGRPDWIEPMMFYAAFHDDGPKTIVRGVRLPAGQGGERDLKQALDTLFHHPNIAPFTCRRLIQRLVTSNPSPGYLYRVSQVFANNGRGERGDLGAVVRAILLDYEARSADPTHDLGYGKLKEPLLRVTALLRAFDASARDGRYFIPNVEGPLAQAPLRSPTVFNFFEPDYVLPGPMAAAGLYAPEYEIFNATTAITVPNYLESFIFTAAKPRENALTLNLEPLVPLVDEPDKLMDYLNLVLCGGSMDDDSRQLIERAMAALPRGASDLDRVRCALQLTVTSRAASIQV